MELRMVHAVKLCLMIALMPGVAPAVDADDAPRLVTVRASGEQTGNVAVNTIDGDRGTRWAVEGPGNWLAFEFDQPVRLERVEIGFVSGHERVYRFDLEVSEDGEQWRRILRSESDGGTEDAQPHAFDALETRHVRFVHRGNSVNQWANIHTITFPGVTVDLQQPAVPDITGPTGLVASQWADATLIAAPIAISFDHAGRAYVTQTTRRRDYDLDIRGFRDWVPDDMSFQSVEDRLHFIHENFDNYERLRERSEYVHRIEDTSGDGRADHAQLFAEGFDTEVTGVAGGVLWFDDNVYLTVHPDVWKLTDSTGDGKADERRSISHGYGVHIAYAGHGMSGMALGPDGRIYWSLGDIGMNVTTAEGRTFAYPNRGAVVRSEPDGSNVEVFAKGLRNTHEIAFDKYGNLFSVDNDGDMPGERERAVYIVEGGEYGWRSNWQYRQSSWTSMPHGQTPYNPWLAEGLFHTYTTDQPAYVLPALSHYSHGPTGMVYNPGTALNEDYRDFFFLSQFPGEIITAFRFEEDGAAFSMVDEHVAHRGILGTGLAFGPDGALYMNDWIQGWNVRDDGAIWRIDDPEAADHPLRVETQTLLAEGMGDRPGPALVDLLDHADMRVRREAQFELVRRDDRERLLGVTVDAERPRLPRIHAMWGLGQIGRTTGDFEQTDELVQLLDDADAEIRAQAAQLAGDVRHEAAGERLVGMLADENLRVRFHAGLALGKLGVRGAHGAVVAMLDENDDEEAYIRHAGVMALLGTADAEAVVDLVEHESAAVRRAAVVALRRLAEPGVSLSLADDDERVAAEAARAIHDDFSIPEALPALAASLIEQPDRTDEALLRRAINANLRLGSPDHAAALAAYAARQDAPSAMRVEALATLAAWLDPPVLDRVEGRYRALEAGDAADVRAALDQHRRALTAGDPPAAFRTMLAHAAGDVRWAGLADTLVGWLEDRDASAGVRQAALEAIGRMEHERLAEAVATAMEDPDESVRGSAHRLLRDLDAEAAAVALAAALEAGSVRERQDALAALGEMSNDAAVETLRRWMERLLEGDVPDELALDVLQAARRQEATVLREQVQAYQAHVEQQQAADPLARHRTALAGGDAERGERVFMEHPGAACIRCHTLGDKGGDGNGDLDAIAPDLADVGARREREYLLQSLVAPNTSVTPGYGTVVVTTTGGRTITAALREETDERLTLVTTEGENLQLATDEVQSRTPPISMMPPVGDVLTPAELRDVVEFLTTLHGEE